MAFAYLYFDFADFADFLNTKVFLTTDFFEATFDYICKRSSLRSQMLVKWDFLSNFQTLCICFNWSFNSFIFSCVIRAS